MRKILSVYAVGMPASMPVKRVIDHVNTISLEANISTLVIAEAKGEIRNSEVDIALLGL